MNDLDQHRYDRLKGNATVIGEWANASHVERAQGEADASHYAEADGPVT